MVKNNVSSPAALLPFLTASLQMLEPVKIEIRVGHLFAKPTWDGHAQEMKQEVRQAVTRWVYESE